MLNAPPVSAASSTLGNGAAPMERASPTDLAMRSLAARSPVPQQLGAVLLLGVLPDSGVATTERLVGERLAAIPRLRQRLVRLPPGCGRPLWLDDPDFDVTRHVRRVECPEPGDEQALIDFSVTVVSAPLPESRPLWTAVVVTGLSDEQTGLVVVLHHVLADGIGGLAVLGRVVDQPADRPAAAAASSFPRPQPSYRRLADDALRSRMRVVTRLPATWRGMRRALTAAGGLRPVRAAPCSLLRRCGPRRRMAVARCDLPALRAAAHRNGGTVNDALLVAVTGALTTLLETRGEALDSVVVTVMVTARSSAGIAELGNSAAPLLVAVPTAGTQAARVRRTAELVHAARSGGTAAPVIAVLGPLFRVLAALGAYRWFLRHQRRFHTIVSNVHGPDEPHTLGGATIRAILPIGVGESGNVSIGFLALSYAGTLTVTVVAADSRPDLHVLAAALQDQLTRMTAPSRPADPPAMPRMS